MIFQAKTQANIFLLNWAPGSGGTVPPRGTAAPPTGRRRSSARGWPKSDICAAGGDTKEDDDDLGVRTDYRVSHQVGN